MSQPEDVQKPKLDPRAGYAPEERLPPVEAPNAGFLLQLFLIPMVIVSIIVMVWLMFSWLAHMGNDPSDLVASLQKGSDKSWQDAATLADLLRDPRKEDLRRDPELAGQLATVLQLTLKDNISPDTRVADQQIQLRCFLCSALGEFHIPDGLPVLIEAMNHEIDDRDLPVRQFAIQATSVLASNVGPETLVDNEEVRSSILKASRKQDEFSEKKTDRANLRLAAAFAMGILGGDDFKDRLAEMLNDPFPNVSYNAATALARHGDPRCTATLILMMDPSNENVVVGEKEIDQEWKRVHVMANAIRAARIYADNNENADLTDLKAAIERLTQNGIAKGVQIEAKETLILWGNR